MYDVLRLYRVSYDDIYDILRRYRLSYDDMCVDILRLDRVSHKTGEDNDDFYVVIHLRSIFQPQ